MNSKKLSPSKTSVAQGARSSQSQQLRIFQTPNLAPHDDILDDFERDQSSSDSNSSVSKHSTKGLGIELTKSNAGISSKNYPTRGSRKHQTRKPLLEHSLAEKG